MLGASERSATIDAEGNFELRGLHVSRAYQVWAAQSGRGFAGNTRCSDRADVVSGAAAVELHYEAGVTVTFAVVDASTGAPIERLFVQDRLVGGTGFDGMISFAPGMGGRAKDFDGGLVTIANLRPRPKQKLNLKVEAIGYAELEREGIELPTVGKLDLGTLRLERGPVVRVEVTATDGAAVANALVRLRERDPQPEGNRREFEFPGFGGGARSVRTDANGRCELNAKRGAQVEIAVTSQEFAPYRSEPLQLPAQGGADHHVRLVRGGTVEVTVVKADGEPAVSESVQHRDANGDIDNAQTDANGTAWFTKLVPGQHGFRVSGRGNRVSADGASVSFELARPAGRAGAPAPDLGFEYVDVSDGTRSTVRLSKAPTATLTGIVRENGSPLAGARVSLERGGAGVEAELEMAFASAFGGEGSGPRGGGRTDDAGRYKLTELAAGEHRLRITHRDRSMPDVVPVFVRAGDNTFDVDLDITILRGTVRDSNGKPVGGASVTVGAASSTPSPETTMFTRAFEGGLEGMVPGGGNRRRVTTDADGRYELRGVVGGKGVVVRVTAKGFSPGRSEPVEPVGGTVTDDVDVTLAAAGSVKVTVATETPFASARATWDGPEADGVAPVMQMVRSGSATLDGLRPGRWRIAVSGPNGGIGEERRVEVKAGGTVELSF
jgi:hypothetical protein